MIHMLYVILLLLLTSLKISPIAKVSRALNVQLAKLGQSREQHLATLGDWLAAQVEVLLVEKRLREIYWQVCKTTSTPTGHTFRDELVYFVSEGTVQTRYK
ncbi:hypothetical protein HYC85_004699 [Camellia sinensis]|uniref:Uncharacterized protein n=1 Tax=Camellia sinensis TaxID=4442 RepID=A0A7J7HZA7_CAMSI|nr:hypothetical protein HYC85_004699 [Camellia sinensis]